MTTLSLLFSVFFVQIISIDSNSQKVQSTEDCGKNYACFKQPENCQDTECSFIFKWKQTKNTSDYHDFLISAKINGPKIRAIWLAIGFSKDPFMGDDSVCLCKIIPDQSSIENYYNTGKSIPVLLDKEDSSAGLSEIEIEKTGNFVSCSFRRKKNLEGVESYFDLENESFYVLAAYGPLDSKGGVRRHIMRTSSDQLVNFNYVTVKNGLSKTNKNLIKAHACLMIIAWIFLVSIGMPLPRYYKFIYPDILINDLKIWFFLHRPIMYFAFFITSASVVIVFVDQNWEWISQDRTAELTHSIFGIILLGFMVFQILIAIFRPHQDKSYRYIFNYTHRYIGLAILLFLTITLFIGVSLERMELELKGIAIIAGWLAWISVFISSLEYFEHIYKPDQKFEYINSSQITYRSDYIKEVERQNIKRVKLERIKIFLGIVHLLGCLGFTFGLIYVIAGT